MSTLTETLPVSCHLVHVDTIGLGGVCVPACYTTREEAERVAAELVGYLDLDQPCRPEWWVQSRAEPHAHQWCPVIPPPAEGP